MATAIRPSSSLAGIYILKPPATETSIHLSQTANNMAESSNTNREMILAGAQQEGLLTEDMGFEVLQVSIGPEPVVFSIHKNLLSKSSPQMMKIINKNSDLKILEFAKEAPAIFRLYIEFLYSRRVPGVTSTMQPLVQAARLKDLCQLYALADRLKLHNEYRNKIMDKIQDGFMLLDKVPEPAMVSAIFKNTTSDSMLRKFAAASLFYYLRSDKYVPLGDLGRLLCENKEITDEFLKAAREASLPEDPRVRQCGSAVEYCAECQGNTSRLEGVEGTDPCRFHLHKIYTKGDNGLRAVAADQSCHLWKLSSA